MLRIDLWNKSSPTTVARGAYTPHPVPDGRANAGPDTTCRYLASRWSESVVINLSALLIEL